MNATEHILQDGLLAGDLNTCVFSECRRYRYRLEHVWAPELPTICWVGLNPSTADEQVHDPTVRREIDFSRRWCYGTYIKVNIFGLRSTNPSELRKHDYAGAVGPDNDYWIAEAVSLAETTVCCWGTHGSYLDRSAKVRQLLGGFALNHLGKTANGQPAHPLYLRKDTPLRPWL